MHDDAGKVVFEIARREWALQLRAAAGTVPPPPEGLVGRAYVTTTSANYFAGTWVLAKMLYRHGAADPLRVYYRPWDAPPARLGELPNVELHDLSAVVPECDDWPGYMIRSALFMRCGLAVPFWLGSDCYPVADVSYAFDDAKARGAVFWQDQPEGDKFAPGMYGLPDEAAAETFQIQGDTMAMDVAQSWRPLSVAHWLNCRGPMWFNRGAWFDESHFRAAWKLCGVPQFKYAPGAVDWQSVPGAFVHQGRDGVSPLIVHRVSSKWHGGGVFSQPLTRDERLPDEAAAWGFYEEWLRG
jgi:hypothetical protein